MLMALDSPVRDHSMSCRRGRGLKRSPPVAINQGGLCGVGRPLPDGRAEVGRGGTPDGTPHSRKNCLRCSGVSCRGRDLLAYSINSCVIINSHQIRTVLSSPRPFPPPEARRVPSGLNATRTNPRCAPEGASLLAGRRVPHPHRLVTTAEASRVPSGLNATPQTPPVCPLRVSSLLAGGRVPDLHRPVLDWRRRGAVPSGLNATP